MNDFFQWLVDLFKGLLLFVIKTSSYIIGIVISIFVLYFFFFETALGKFILELYLGMVTLFIAGWTIGIIKYPVFTFSILTVMLALKYFYDKHNKLVELEEIVNKQNLVINKLQNDLDKEDSAG